MNPLFDDLQMNHENENLEGYIYSEICVKITCVHRTENQKCNFDVCRFLLGKIILLSAPDAYLLDSSDSDFHQLVGIRYTEQI